MNAVDIINKKKYGHTITKEEINYMVDGYLGDTIPDYQMSAFLMATYFQELPLTEIAYLTEAMVNSGDQIDLSFIGNTVVDKHSTGGIGDNVSLIVSPIVASLGVPVAKMSGRGLGFTGGTLDKLESIKGFKVELTEQEFKENMQKIGIAIIGQTKNLVPADKKIYALRDVTGTVDSIPLIASSILSKKVAGGADAIVLDIKVGNGAFMKTEEEARRLANIMAIIGEKKLNRKIVALLTHMNQPLGNEVGNLNEVQETVKILQGEVTESDLLEVSIEVASQMVSLGKKDIPIETARELVKDSISNGKAYEKFVELVKAQGGDISSIFRPYSSDTHENEVKSDINGYINEVDTQSIGQASLLLGAGRLDKDDVIDHEAGISVGFKIGDKVNVGDVLFTIRTKKNNIDEVEDILRESVKISENAVGVVQSAIIDVIS